MSENGSRLSPLLATHDLRVVCAQCCVEEGEITYTLREVHHKCQRNILLCKVKGRSKWRPVSRRPQFPNPHHYFACWFFKEGVGCTEHRNRCTFARSEEEAAVWTFEKHHGLDRANLCHLLARSEAGPGQPNGAEPAGDLFADLDLRVACGLCSVKEKEITYAVQSIIHTCGRNVLLAKAKASEQWRPVAERPTNGFIGRNVFYKVCNHFVEGSGCSEHREGCTYARSPEEAMVWNYARENKMNKEQLIGLVAESQPAAVTPERAAESILQQFSGEFIELCKHCYQERPQKLATKWYNDTCAADASHAWSPVFVHHLSENSRKHVYSQLRPLPNNCQFKFCSHVRQGKPCWHQAGHCQSAQSEVEMAVWKAEHGGLSVRNHLLELSGRARSRQVSMYCKVCHLLLSSPESFYKHCASLEHGRLLAEDTSARWRGRQPPHGRRAEFRLCERPKTCEYGNKCPKAHCDEELQEWMMRAGEEEEIRHNMEAQGLMSYNQRLLEEYKDSSNEVYIISEHVDDVTISCDEELTVECEKIDDTLRWIFEVETERELVHVALLKQEPGASFTLSEPSSAPCIYSSGESFLTEDATYDITVSFTSVNPGLYEQWLVMDFGMRPVLLKKLRVRVGQPPLDDAERPTADLQVAFQKAERWHRGNRVIIPCSTRTEEQEELLKEYKAPQMNLWYKSSHNSQTPLNNHSYKERMHQFLYNEERAEDQVVSRLNVCGEITTAEMLYSPLSGLQLATQGQLFCAVPIPYNLTLDSPEGLALKRSIQCGLVAPLPSAGPNSKVYEANVLQHNTDENKMYLQLSKQCCSDLALESNKSYQMEIQFQLDRHAFCTLHKAVDLLPDTSTVLPDLSGCAVPVGNVTYENLNAKQQSAVDFITGKPTVKKPVAPLLIYGPFGTGKTFTLATAARELCENLHNKVLICTHTNSSADLYVRDHFHPFISKKNDVLKPIRIKANKQGSALAATDQITLKYCFLSDDRHSFLPPTKAALDRHNVVITTTTMARHFHDLRLPEGYFTHILVDEASQMLECEALMPLGLAGPNTRVVLAGDHMQMGPKLFSVDDHHSSNHTLLTRLFHYYQGRTCEAALNSRVIFSENYRSTQEIVEFVSTHFYVGKNDVIKASGNIPAPTNGHALKFHHVRGECILDTVTRSWYNRHEVYKVVQAVTDILEHWPSTWGSIDLRSICVLSEGCQVRQIRSALLKKNLAEVHAENIANVQGKQFRVVIMTAVQTRDSLQTSHVPGLELFNDARVFNTAMTRAQSQVVVVGDAAALCCFGKCSGIWKSFIDHCISNNSVAPQHFTKDFFEKDVMETTRFQKSERVDESNTVSDAILQELKDEYEQLKTDNSSDEENSDFEDSNHKKPGAAYDITGVDTDLLELCDKQPDMFKRGLLYREAYNKGYFIPHRNPARRISVQGRANLGKAFTGDEVILQTEKGVQTTARVVCITKKAEFARELVCLLEDEDYSKTKKSPSRTNPSDSKFVRRTMVPIAKSAPKVCILTTKNRRNYIPVWEQIDGDWTIASQEHVNENRNNLFVVKVIGWRDLCIHPLGRVTDILPYGGPSHDKLWLLKEEMKVEPPTWYTNEGSFSTDEDEKHRKDECKLITFTVDPKRAKDLDDAISVGDMGNHYVLGVHVADVASYVSPGDGLDTYAEQQGTSFYCSRQEPVHMFPQNYSTKCFSLLPGQKRRVVSLLFEVEKETNKIIGKPKPQLSWISSNRQLSYEEAEDIITARYKESPKYGTVEDCVTVAYCFARVQRRARLDDWAYSQSDDDRLPGKRKAHLMIEELSVLFNKHTSETLMSWEETRYCTPLRCQARPDPKQVEEFRENCRELIPLSFHVKGKVDNDYCLDEQTPSYENFRILPEVWEAIKSAARTDDIDKMVDLIAADDIHPLLQPVITQFKECMNRAYIVRSKSSPKADIGHYSLNVPSYTQASSPIRRYMDLILQRLLHCYICERTVPYTKRKIDALCSQFEDNLKKAKEYEQKAEQISYAVSMKKQSASKLAYVVRADSEGDGFAVSFPFNKNIFARSLYIMYRELQLEDQPSLDEANHTTLKWKRRIYAAGAMQIHQELRMLEDGGRYIEIPVRDWKATVDAINMENWVDAKRLIMNANTIQQKQHSAQPEVSEVPQNHLVDIDLTLLPGDMLRIQMTSEEKRGNPMPVVQLVHVKPKFEICVDHVHSPLTCFSVCADRPSRISYSDSDVYVEIWKPICEMESAHTAVDESDGVIIENLVVNFSQKQEGQLRGSFFLPEKWIRGWAIEFNLAKCYLCIRKRGLRLKSFETMDHSALVDPREFTWVAHGVTESADKRKNDGSKVEFYVNHLPMENIPDCVFQRDTPFTVEIIPKTLPDIRKENAVVSLRKACELVQRIALGHRIPKNVVQSSVLKHQIVRQKLPGGLPKLNDSQYDAVLAALNHTFTLIQGPPGTGKTVVGVYIVYWFLKLNSQNPRKLKDPEDRQKKEVILYCGPSNKSVDVVAEYLMKFKDSLKPLRVYSQQVEVLDYPYPEGTVQFSPRSLRQDRSKPELRSITLHHRMRQPPNPYADQIRRFDQRIKDKEELTDDELKKYTNLLRDARVYELQQHDIILCTCTQSSTPSLPKTVSARQILIDECAMATEPQALIPLVCNQPEKVVLIGDHKQLRPIVKNERVRKLGMAKSLFERYEDRAVMLKTQYRMHEDICKFPSDEFYHGELKTGAEQPSSVLRVEGRTMAIVFGHIKGETVRLVVKTAKGNTNSKVNRKERDKVIEIAKMLVEEGKVEQKSIVILSPYNAQVSEIKEELKKTTLGNITVTTITKSQGSEWRYVIISTVCSLPSKEIVENPEGAWLAKHLGFVGDPNQINVAITRAKEGLCIIGNQKLLSCNVTWRHLLNHYTLHNAVTKADKISVHPGSS